MRESVDEKRVWEEDGDTVKEITIVRPLETHSQDTNLNGFYILYIPIRCRYCVLVTHLIC